jgi:hypothetical protein
MDVKKNAEAASQMEFVPKTQERAVAELFINDRNDNALQLRMQERQALASYRLTSDRGNSFVLDMGSSVQVGDKRQHVSPDKTSSIEQITQGVEKWIDKQLKEKLAKRPVYMNESQFKCEVTAIENFRKDLHIFRDTACVRGLKSSEIESTLRQIHRLMSEQDSSQINLRDRQYIAEQIMSHAAHPTSIDQGRHNTCTVAAVESATFTRHPAEAAKLIADIAEDGSYISNGQFRGLDGKLSPLKVDVRPEKDEEANAYQQSGVRTYASELFQVAAVNLYYANQNRLRNEHKGYQQFASGRDDTDTGERIIDSRDGHPLRPEVKSPRLRDGAVGFISRAITGVASKSDTLIVSDTYRSGGSDYTTGIHSLRDLRETLSRFKAEDGFPVFVKVNCMCEPFYLDARLSRASGSNGAHAVTIRDYDAKTGSVMIDNQWGDSADHRKNNPVDIRDLFVATQSNEGAINVLQHMIADDYKRGRFDLRKRMQLLRLSNLVEEITDSEYAKKVHQAVEVVASRWDHLPGKEKLIERSELIAMTRELKDRQRDEQLLEIEKRGMLSVSEYNKEHLLRLLQSSQPDHSIVSTKPPTE